MKKILCLSILLSFAMFSFSQSLTEKDIPVPSMQHFKNSFADAKDVKWAKVDTVKYQASFVKEEMKTSVVYGKAGDWQITKWEMAAEYTPKAISDYIKKNFADYKVKTIFLTDSPQGRNYIVTITKKKKEKIDLYFSLDNTFVKRIPEDKNEKPASAVAPATEPAKATTPAPATNRK